MSDLLSLRSSILYNCLTINYWVFFFLFFFLPDDVKMIFVLQQQQTQSMHYTRLHTGDDHREFRSM